MSKIDLTSLEWRELVFQGKNKAYGAYQLRGESDKRHNRAMLIVTLVAVIGFSMPKLIEMATPEQKEVNETVTELSQLEKAEVKNDIKKATEVAPPPPLKSTIKFVAPVIAKDEEVSEEDEMKSQEELTNANVQISVADVKGVTGGTVDIADVKQAVTEVAEPEKIWDVIEQMPSFPGGDGELMATLSKNIKYPVIAQENGIQGKVILGFVVTKSGAISDVTVLRSLDPSCDKEAIRVVKLLPKWIPGKQNGENVNVRYTLPVVFRLQE